MDVGVGDPPVTLLRLPWGSDRARALSHNRCTLGGPMARWSGKPMGQCNPPTSWGCRAHVRQLSAWLMSLRLASVEQWPRVRPVPSRCRAPPLLVLPRRRRGDVGTPTWGIVIRSG